MIKRDDSHLDFIKRWAKRVREDKDGKWREEQKYMVLTIKTVILNFINTLKAPLIRT